MSIARFLRRLRPFPQPAPTTGWRVEVCPPSLRQAPEGFWPRLWFWFSAPAPTDVAPPPSRLPAVRDDFLAAAADLCEAEGAALAERIARSMTLRDLWHLRVALHAAIGRRHGETEAAARLERLNRHFPTRAPRSGLAPLSA